MDPHTRVAILCDTRYALRQLRECRCIERAIAALERIEATVLDADWHPDETVNVAPEADEPLCSRCGIGCDSAYAEYDGRILCIPCDAREGADEPFSVYDMDDDVQRDEFMGEISGYD